MTADPAHPFVLDGAQMIPGMMTFMGFRAGAGPYTEISLLDYYDPDGAKGIKALYITLGWNGCGACLNEAVSMNAWQTEYGSKGLRQLSALHSDIDTPNGDGPATESTARNWIKKYGITYDVVIDPMNKLNNGVKPASDPHAWFVDPATMQTTVSYPGAPSSYIWQMGLNTLLQ